MVAEARPKDGLRCHHCAGPLSKDMETSGWNLPPLIRDSFSMIGSAVGGTASAFYGFNHVMPVVRRWVKASMWLHFLIGVSVATFLFAFSDVTAFSGYRCADVDAFLFRAPPVIVFSSACAGLTGGAVPALTQLASSSYHAAISSHSPPSSTEGDKMHKPRASSTL